MKAKRKPILVKRGNVTVRIYPYLKNGAPYYHVADYSSGKRVFRGFSEPKLARTEAALIATRMSIGDQDVLELRSADRAAYLRATQLLRPTGTPLESAIAQFVEARQLLGNHSLVEAARYYVRRDPIALPRKTVREVVDEFLADKEAKGKGDRYLMDLRYRCGNFANSFKCALADVTAAQIEKFLLSLKLSTQSYMNFRRVIGTLLAFAKRWGYLPKDHDELERVEKLTPDNGEIEIYTPHEFIRLITAADEDFLPSLLLGGFAGLRSSEIERLDWRELHLDERFIEIKKKKTKTASRRLVPIVDNLAEWLAPFVKQNGLVWPQGHDAFYDTEQATAKATQVDANPEKGIAAQESLKWRQNALRHSFISYRLAVLQNENQVAMESGNSPVMIHKHYKQLVSPAVGAKWFGIRPDSRLAEKTTVNAETPELAASAKIAA